LNVKQLKILTQNYEEILQKEEKIEL